MENRVFVFGDVHGEITKLESLIKRVKESYGSIDIYSTGDLIDRGPASMEVVDFVIKNNIKAVMGNHEELLVELIKGDRGAFYMHVSKGMGGDETVRSYVKGNVLTPTTYMDSMPSTHKEFYLNLPLYRVIDLPNHSYIVSHAGFRKTDTDLEVEQEWIHHKNYDGRRLTEMSEDQQLEILSIVDKDNILWDFKKPEQIKKVFSCMTQITGHLPAEKVRITSESIQIDTGCGKGGKLTGIVLPDREIISV